MTPDSITHATNKPPVRVLLKLVLSVKFSSIDTDSHRLQTSPLLGYHLGSSSLLNSFLLTLDSHRLLTSPLLGCHLSNWSCLLNSLVLTSDSHRLLTRPLLGCHLGWSCLLNSLVLTPDSHKLRTSPLLGCHLVWSLLVEYYKYPINSVILNHRKTKTKTRSQA